MLESMRRAVLAAIPSEMDPPVLRFTPSVDAATACDILEVRYVAGNEFMDLAALRAALAAVGDVLRFELRGRGRNEHSSLFCTVRAGGKLCSLRYFLS